MMLYEAGNFETALIRLEENSVCITDRLKYLETRGDKMEINMPYCMQINSKNILFSLIVDGVAKNRRS